MPVGRPGTMLCSVVVSVALAKVEVRKASVTFGADGAALLKPGVLDPEAAARGEFELGLNVTLSRRKFEALWRRALVDGWRWRAGGRELREQLHRGNGFRALQYAFCCNIGQ